MAGTVFRRGFKKEAEQIAIELRGELRLGPADRLVPEALAEYLAIPVRTLHDFVQLVPHDAQYLLGRGRSVFSAVTVHVGKYRRLIITNPAHALTRQMSSLCHELSHVLLGHEGESPLNVNSGREWNRVQEREADWLAGCLLIPQAAAHQAALRGHSDEEVATLFGVSRSLARWRMNATGARLRAHRMGLSR